MSAQPTQSAWKRPRRKLGCLPRLIIFAVLMSGCYWLVFAPIQPQGGGLPSGDATPTGNTGSPGGPVVDGELTPQQETGLQQIAAESSTPPEVLVEGGAVRFLSANVSVPDGIAISPQEKAMYFLKENGEFFQLEDAGRNLRLEGTTEDGLGNTYVRYSQQYMGVPVYGSDIIVGVNANDEIDFLNAGYVPNLEIDVQPTVRSVEAERVALEDLGAEDGELTETTYLAIYAPEVWGESAETYRPKLAWFVTVGFEGGFASWLYVVDAKEGGVLDKVNLLNDVGGELNLEILETINGTWEVVMDENGAVLVDDEIILTSEEARNAFDRAHTVYDYFWDSFIRDSYDGDGGLVQIYVGVSSECDQWDGSKKIISVCSGSTEGIDVIAHEFMHGVVDFTANFVRQGESLALDESFGDLSAAFMDNQEPWLISRSPIESGGKILRNLEDVLPPFPDNYSEIYCNPSSKGCCPEELDGNYPDCGHINSILFSHAAYLMAEGIDKNGITIDPVGLYKVQYIYYYALKYGLNSSSQFKQAALTVLGSCSALTRPNEFSGKATITNSDCEQVKNAFIAVGLIVIPVPPPNMTPVPTLTTTPSPIVYPPPVPGGQSWWELIREFLRNWIDQLSNEVRQQIEDWIAQQLILLEDALKQGLQRFLEQLLQSLLDFCSGSAAPATVPLLLYYHRRNRKKH